MYLVNYESICFKTLIAASTYTAHQSSKIYHTYNNTALWKSHNILETTNNIGETIKILHFAKF